MSKKRKPKGLSWAGKAGLYAGKGVRGVQKYRARAPERRRLTLSRLKEAREIQRERAQIGRMKAQIRKQKLAPFVSAYRRGRRIVGRRPRARAPTDDTGTRISIRVSKPRPRVEKKDEGELRMFDLGDMATFEDIGEARKKRRKKTKLRRFEI